MCATFNGHPCTTIVSCYGLTNANDKMDINTFNNELFFLVRYIPKHNGQTIGEDMNVHKGKNGNKKFCLHSSLNRNGEYLADFSLGNKLVRLNSQFRKKEGKIWTIIFQNDTARLCIHKQNCINSVVNCNAYSSFEGVYFDYRSVSAKIYQSLHRNKTQYDWFSLTNSDIKKQYTVTVRNKFGTLKETSERHIPNDEYENFVTTHIKTAAKCLPKK